MRQAVGVLTLSLAVALVGAASSSAAATTASLCMAAEPTATAKACGVGNTVPATVVTLSPVDPLQGRYQLWITSRKGGLVKPVNWSPPANMKIVAITSSDHGRCALVAGRIACVAPDPVQSVTVNFTAERPITVITFLDIPRGLYQLSVTGYVDSFSWAPPNMITITAITSSEGGRCTLTPDGNISCHGSGGKGITPPPSGFLPDHASLTVNFTATGPPPSFNGKYYTWYGVTSGRGWFPACGPMTPCPYHVPTGLVQQNDFPLCGSALHPSKVSTVKSPCSIR